MGVSEKWSLRWVVGPRKIQMKTCGGFLCRAEALKDKTRKPEKPEKPEKPKNRKTRKIEKHERSKRADKVKVKRRCWIDVRTVFDVKTTTTISL